MDGRIEAALVAADLVQLAEQAGSKLRRQGAEWRGNCPLHGGDNPNGFAIYNSGGKQHWHCFTRDCGHGDVIDFVVKLHNTDLRGALQILTGESVPDQETVQRLASERAQRQIESLQAEIQRAQAVLEDLKTSQRVDIFSEAREGNQRARQLWRARGVSDEMQGFWRLGYCERFGYRSGDEMYSSPSLTIPVWGDGWELRTLRHRLLQPANPGDKYRPDKAGLGAHPFIADPDNGYNLHRVLLVEGEIKAMVVYQTLDDPTTQVIGVPGKTTTQAVIKALAGSGHDVVVIFDPDAESEARQTAVQVGGRFIHLPVKIDDAILTGDISKAGLRFMLQSARRERTR